MDVINKSQQFLSKLSQLPAEVELYFSSSLSGRILDSLSEKYTLSRDSLDDLLQDLFIGNLNFSLLDKFSEDNITSVKPRREFTREFLGRIFLPLAQFLKLNIVQEIELRGGTTEEYQPAVFALGELIEEENMREADELVSRYDSEIDYKEEAIVAVDLISNNLVDILKSTDNEANVNLNRSFIRLLHKDPSFKNKASSSLLENEELITSKSISLEGKNVQPTISNWLKDFIVENGSAMYNSVVLSRYIASSANPKNLSPEEKKLVNRLLKLYKNLLFFPDSLANIPPEDWEIIPIDREAIASSKKKQSELEAKQAIEALDDKKSSVKTEESQAPLAPITDIPKPEIISKDSDKASSAQVNPATEKFEKIKRLAELSSQYPAGSLERKAVDEEVKRLSVK